MKKKISALLLVLVMLLSLFPTTAMAKPDSGSSTPTVKSVALSVTPPAIGETPDDSVSITAAYDTSDQDVKDSIPTSSVTAWKIGNDPAGTTFEESKEYTVVISLTTTGKNNLVFNGDSVATVNGGSATITVPNPNGQPHVATVTCTFPALSAKTPASVTTEPAAAENLTYDGAPKTLVSAGVAENGTMKYLVAAEEPTATTGFSGDLPTATNAGTYKVWYYAAATDDTYADSAIADPVVVTIEKATLTASDFTYTAPESLTYDNTEKSASVAFDTKDDTLTGCGDVTVKYSSDSSTYVDATPTNAGTYYVFVGVTGGDNYNAAENLHDESWTFTITPADLSEYTVTVTPETYNGSPAAVTVTKEGAPAPAEGTDYEVNFYAYDDTNGTGNYCGDKLEEAPAGVGTYVAEVKAIENGNFCNAVYKTFTINEYPTVATVKFGETAGVDSNEVGGTDSNGWNHEWSYVEDAADYVEISDTGASLPQVTGKKVGTTTLKHEYWKGNQSKNTQLFAVEVTKGDGAANVVAKTGDELNYTGSAVELATATASTGDVTFAVVKTGEAKPETCTATVAQATDVGEYVVYYAVAASDDGNYAAKEVTEGPTVAINPQVTYHANGGVFAQGSVQDFGNPSETELYPTYNGCAENIPDDAGETVGALIVTNDTKVFAGWYTNPECTKSYNFETPVTANLDLYAKWVDAAYSVTVKASYALNFKNSKNVTAALYRGSEKIAEKTYTLTSGGINEVTFEEFTQIPAGNYTLKVSYSDNSDYATMTTAVTVDESLTDPVSVVLQQNKEYTLTVADDMPDVTVDGLDEAFEDVTSGVAVTVEKVTEGDAVTAIEAEDHSTYKTYLDITVYKNGTDPANVQTSTDGLLTFTVAFPTASYTNITVYRYHDYGTDEPDWKVDELTATKNEAGEYIEVGDGFVTIYAKYFSVYAIGYDDIVYDSDSVTTYAITCGEGVTADRKNASAGTTVILTVAEGYTDPVVTDKNGKTVAVKFSNGKYTFKMPSSKVTVSAKVAADTVCADFADVNVNNWSHDGIHFCLENGLMNGVGANTFAPNGITSRAMMWTILARMDGCDTAGGELWYSVGQSWAMTNDVSDGTMPEGTITREQFATMLYRYAQSQGKGFTGSWMFPLDFSDASSISDWANEAMHWCVMKGILNGKGANNLDPQGALTRAEAAAMIQRYVEN